MGYKIVQINSTANWGSTGKIAEMIGKLIRDAGMSSYIGWGRYCNDSESELIKIGNRWSIYGHVVETLLLDRHGFGSIYSTKKFLRRLESLNPDIIHLHNIHGYYINIKLLFEYLKNKKIPVVWTLHDCWAITGHCAYFDYVKCDRWKTICYRCPQKYSYPKNLLYSQATRNFIDKRELFTSIDNLHIVTVSNWLKKVIDTSFLKEIPSEVIYNGIDLEVFRNRISSIREKYGLNGRKILLGVANEWDERKGIDDFIKLSKYLDPSFQIVLIGISRRMNKNLPQNIIGINRTQNSIELAEWYSAADIYINTSREETFGLTTVEAMACGTPVLVANRTASPELVSDLVGDLYEPGNIEELNQKVGRILKKDKNQYSVACADRVYKNYNNQKNIEQYLKLYKRILKQDVNI